VSVPLGIPFLLGKQVVLRGVKEADLKGNYSRWFDDAEVNRFNSHHRLPSTAEQTESFFRRMSVSSTDLWLAMTLRDSGEHIGNIALHGIQWVDRTAEYAIVLGERTAWGRGIAKEASVLILRHGFLELNLHRVHCGTSEDNLAMQALARFMGMTQEGRRRAAIFKSGRHRDVLEYGILRDEFLERHPAAPSG
jgi:RimJ/RimL family protein N-acetyltransferase